MCILLYLLNLEHVTSISLLLIVTLLCWLTFVGLLCWLASHELKLNLEHVTRGINFNVILICSLKNNYVP